jgi:hypothetical protein
MNRKTMRMISIVVMFAFAGWLVYEGLHGMVFARSEMPLHFVGFFIAACAGLGMCGVNIWRGGPLDIRNDP